MCSGAVHEKFPTSSLVVLTNHSEEPKTPPKGTLTLCMSLKVLKEKNVKGIAVNVPGHGFTSGDPLRRMGDWAKSDVEPVLEAEGVPKDAPLIVEGSSFGSAHAHSVMHYFQDRIATIHFQVPALSFQSAGKRMSVRLILSGFLPTLIIPVLSLIS